MPQALCYGKYLSQTTSHAGQVDITIYKPWLIIYIIYILGFYIDITDCFNSTDIIIYIIIVNVHGNILYLHKLEGIAMIHYSCDGIASTFKVVHKRLFATRREIHMYPCMSLFITTGY